jgi:hypothetical protein
MLKQARCETAMTSLDAQRAAHRRSHRLVDAGCTPNGLYRMLVCERCGAADYARLSRAGHLPHVPAGYLSRE